MPGLNVCDEDLKLKKYFNLTLQTEFIALKSIKHFVSVCVSKLLKIIQLIELQ